ncbi:MAG: T9SS type A sorting domain-containing protein [Chitinophagales bacterium]
MNNNIKVYPNPVSNQLMVASNIDMSSIQIFSLEGRLVKQVLDNMSIDMSDLPANQYIVKIITKEGVLMKRVVKVND